MENQSLIITLVLVSSASNIALFVNWANSKHIRGLLTIAIGFFITCVGMLLLTTQGTLPPVVSIVIASALTLGGHIPIVIGLAAFWNQERSLIPLLVSIWFLGTMIAFYYFTIEVDSPIVRIRIYTIMMEIFSFCNIYIIATGLHRESKLRPAMELSSNYGAFLALMLFSFNAVIEFILMTVRTGSPLSEADDGTSLLLLGSIFTMVVFAFAIIIMTIEELSVENKESSIFDPITTILNHRAFMEIGQRVVGVALRYHKPVSMLTIDVENMDEVVKEHGYKVSNDMLRHFSLMASDRRRNEDVLSRSGEKEFRMLLPGVDEAGAQVVIDKIQNTLLAEEYIYRGNVMQLKVTIAAITRREEGLDLQQMLREGQMELYDGKQLAHRVS